MVRNLCTKIEEYFHTMVHIPAACASFLEIYGILYGVLPISLEAGQIWSKRQLSLVPDFLQNSFLGSQRVVLSQIWCLFCAVPSGVPRSARSCEKSFRWVPIWAQFTKKNQKNGEPSWGVILGDLVARKNYKLEIQQLFRKTLHKMSNLLRVFMVFRAN